MIIPASLDEDEAVARTGLALSTFRRWRREGYGPPFNTVKNVVLYIQEGFDAAVIAALKPGARPLQPVGKKVDKRKREAGRHMQATGPDAALIKRTMNGIRAHADRVEHKDGRSFYYHLNVTGEACFVFEGETLIEIVEND